MANEKKRTHSKTNVGRRIYRMEMILTDKMTYDSREIAYLYFEAYIDPETEAVSTKTDYNFKKCTKEQKAYIFRVLKELLNGL